MMRGIVIIALCLGTAACLAGWSVNLAGYGFGYVSSSYVGINVGHGVLGVGRVVNDGPYKPGQFSYKQIDGLVWLPYWVSNTYTTGIALPLWIPFLAFAAYPSITFIRGPLRRWRRKRAGACLRCGYDLTGNVTGVCPECGSSRCSNAANTG